MRRGHWGVAHAGGASCGRRAWMHGWDWWKKGGVSVAAAAVIRVCIGIHGRDHRCVHRGKRNCSSGMQCMGGSRDAWSRRKLLPVHALTGLHSRCHAHPAKRLGFADCSDCLLVGDAPAADQPWCQLVIKQYRQRAGAAAGASIATARASLTATPPIRLLCGPHCLHHTAGCPRDAHAR